MGGVLKYCGISEISFMDTSNGTMLFSISSVVPVDMLESQILVTNTIIQEAVLNTNLREK